MDEAQQGSPAPEDRSSKTAAALRALRDGLGTKLETHRRRISDLEADLTARVLQIAEELSAEQAAESQAEMQLHEEQVRRLRESLAEREGMIIKLEKQLSETELKHLRLTAELTESRSAIEAVRHTECSDCSRLRSDLAAAHSSSSEADRRLAELKSESQQSAIDLKQALETIAKLEAAECQYCAEFEGKLAEAKQCRQASDDKYAELSAELDRVRQQLDDSEQALDTLRATECADCGRLRLQLATLQETSATAEAQVAKLSEQVDELVLQLRQARAAEAELRAQHAADDSALTESRVSAEKTLRLLNEKVSAITAERDAVAEQLAGSDAELSALKVKARQELSSLEAKSAASELANHQLNDQVAELHAERDELSAQLAEVQTELKSVRDVAASDLSELESQRVVGEATLKSLTEKVAALAGERDELAEQLTQIQAELTARSESSDSELSWLEKECEAAEQSRKQLAREFEELLKQHKAGEQALSAAEIKNEQAVALLKRAEEKILQLSESTEHREALEQAERKFELALADAQKLKRENSDLQEELARRPEKSETESPELVSLRVERDALASRVAELEAAPVPIVDADSEQQLADLRRRFELAVEDLRHLKQENAQLQDKLSHVGSNGGNLAPSHVAMDWQSQKARLLAALDAEDVEEDDAERRQERTTIEGTITITDRVVADKDREIADLKAQLADQAFTVIESAAPQSISVDKDELILAERAKLEALQKEWHDKLRAAELEMSVQRASLARKEAELQQKLQAAQQAQADAPVGPDGKPKRRWLSALGLRDDEEK
jgi:chromosome segregation ATPase